MKKKKLYLGAMISILGIGFICGGLGSLTGDGKSDHKKSNPLNRGDNFENFSLKNYLLQEGFTKKIQKSKIVNNKYCKVLDDELFIESFKVDFRKILGKIDRFKSKQNDYKVDLHYLCESENYILFDVVWYIPNTNWFFYDQLKIFLY